LLTIESALGADCATAGTTLSNAAEAAQIEKTTLLEPRVIIVSPQNTVSL
jgi:hypothetical protein